MPYISYFFKFYNLLYIFLLIVILFRNSLCSIETGESAYIKRLNSGKYIIISSSKIIFSDSTLTESLSEYSLGSNIYNNDNNIGSTTVAQFKSTDNGYIIAVVNQKLFIFSSTGEYMKNITISYIFAKFPCWIIPYYHSENNYFFTLIYPSTVSGEENEKCDYIKLRKGTFNSYEKTIEFDNEVEFAENIYSTISCDIMININQEFITCFYGTENYFACTKFDQNDYSNISTVKYTDNIEGQYFKSVIFPDNRQKAILCGYKSGGFLYCLNYDITTNSFSDKIQINQKECRSNPTSLIMEYFYETEQFLIGCLGHGTKFYMSKANDNLTFNEINTEVNIDSYPKRINVVLPEGQTSYNIFGSNLQQSIITTINIINTYPVTEPDETEPASTILICPIYYSYDHTECLESVPDGYYCNNITEKTIDKCHENCKTCEQSGTDQNNNCKSCYDTGKIYFNLGNCLSESQCSNGFFTDSDSIKKCKCLSNIKCLLCNSASNQYNLCESCNEGYYKKLGDESNKEGYFNCYNNSTIGDGYYLSTDSNLYEPCYESCKNCNGKGDSLDNKCTECNTNYLFIINTITNVNNCYLKCPHYFYFNNTGDYNCLSEDKCPEGYKLIYGTNKCINDCSTETIYNYRFEYNNTCYESCPNGTHKLADNSYECEADLICEYYYNYNHTDCLINITDGYYCNDTIHKTIDKCHQNCKTCKKGGDDIQNNCETCKDSGTKFYELGNCKEECEHGSYEDSDLIQKCKCSSNITCLKCDENSNAVNLCISCNNEEGFYKKSDDEIRNDGFVSCYQNLSLEGYYLNNNIYEPCYLSCKSCSGSGSQEDNKCTLCKDEYETIDNLGNNNCYKKCDYNYYFDENNNYKCTENDSCPENFSKLIASKKLCIKDCSEDSTYRFNFNDVCYSQCPNGTHNDSTNMYQCISDLNCEYKNQYYSYDLTECINGIPDGYYCNNEIHKTIEKCHSNCKTCEKGGTDTNNNCLTCNDGDKKYFNLGNCVSELECIHDFFTDDDSIIKCKCTSNIKCKKCNETSLENDLCISCNMDEGYYPKRDDNNTQPYYNCYMNPEGYYLNLSIQVYEPCYISCQSCNELGDEMNNKCSECKSGYEYKNDSINNNICYKKCDNYYYYDESNIYECTEENSCPSIYNKIIPEKKRCIKECQNDNIYKYEYQNICYDTCPPGTFNSKDNIFICEQIKQITTNVEVEVIQTTEIIETTVVIKPTEITEVIEEDKNKCELRKNELVYMDVNELEYMNENLNITNEFINSLTEKYKNKFFLSNNFVVKQEYESFTIYIYKNLTCLQITTNEAPQIDFGECYNKAQLKLGVNEELIIAIALLKDSKNLKPLTKFYFANPLNGKLLNISEICFEEKIIINEDVITLMSELDNQKEEFILFLTKQGIDVFNLSEEFYNDMCFEYESPNGKDVPMKDRISSFYPNITLCDKGCDNKGVDLETMKAKCECTLSNLMNNGLMDNLYGQAVAEVMEIISSLNIAVVQCIMDLFNKDKFKKCIGGYFILGLLAGQIGCIIKFIIDGLYSIRKYIFSLSENFYLYMQRNPGIKSPPLKKNKTVKMKSNIQNESITNSTHKFIGNSKMKNSHKGTRTNLIISNKHTNSPNSEKNTKGKSDLNNLKTMKRNATVKPSSKFMKLKIKAGENTEGANPSDQIKDLLSDSIDETDFDDVLDCEKRKFCEYFSEKFKSNQIFINTFCIQEIFRPKSLKILILIMTIELYFVINALFYNEDYLSILFNSNKKDSFFSFVPRRFNQFVYTSAVSGIISYLIGYFFVEEEKLKRIFLRNKDDNTKLKYELSILIKSIEKRFIGLIFLSLFLSVISFVYISCFNIVYPYIRVEWIKYSIFILFLMQIINFLITFLHSSLRYIAINYNSEKVFRLSVLFA